MILGFDRGTYEREQRERLNKLNREMLEKALEQIKNDIKDLKSSVLSIQERLNKIDIQ